MPRSSRSKVFKRRQFQYVSCFKSVNGCSLTKRFNKRNHKHGPFEVGKRVRYVGSLPIVGRVRNPRFSEANAGSHILENIGAMPQGVLDEIGSISNPVLGHSSWLNSHSTYNLFSRYEPEFENNKHVPSVNEGLTTLKPFLRKLNLPFVPVPPIKESVYSVSIVESAHPGILLRRAVSLHQDVRRDVNKLDCLSSALCIYEAK